MLLSELDHIEWKKLSHAYGRAHNVPDLVRGLASGSAKRRASSMFHLGASICHQGTLYSATAPVVPFLIELLQAPKVKDKEAIAHLLTDIVTLDDMGPLLLDGAPMQIKALPAAFRKAIEAVRKGTAVYLAQLSAKEPEVRAAAAYLLTWLPNAAKEAAPILELTLEKEKAQGVKVSCALALAYAGRALGSTAPDAALRRLLRAKPIALRAGGAIALSHLHAGEVDEEVIDALGAAVSKKTLEIASLPWMKGDLAPLAARVLAALPRTDRTDDLLLAALEAKGRASSFAASLLVGRLFPPLGQKEPARQKDGVGARRNQEDERVLAALPVKLESLDARQRRLMTAIADVPDALAGDLSTALRECGLPFSSSLLERWLGGPKVAAPSLLDREIDFGGKKQLLAEVFIAAVKATGAGREEALSAMRSATTPEEQIDLAVQGMVDIDLPWIATISLELAWAAAPCAPAYLHGVAARLAKEGAPKRESEHGTIEFPMVFVLVGVGLASIALERKEHAPKEADELLQGAYGYWPRVRDALAALPVERREKWVLDEKRDDQAQPAEFFKGAWPYWTAVPTRRVAERALQHVKTWKAKDPWGGSRRVHADPLLADLIAALRSAGNGADADRCAEALAKLR